MDLMQILADKKKIQLHLHVKNHSIPKIKVDVMRFREVIENLIGNAIEYSLKPGTVDITLSKKDKDIVISVEDTGIGISNSDQKKLFSKFFRSETAIKHNPEGSGLGLYVVKSYVEGWSGKIVVKSSEGKGSKFTVYLPISQKKSSKKEASV